uniref:Phosphotransferase n=1 Tax=Acrobeloides nanus TaxID=290746 RepID=A0A914D7C4_9BILA
MFSGVDQKMCTGPQENVVEKLIPVYFRNFLHIDVNEVQEACRQLELHDDQLRLIMDNMNERFENGLAAEPTNTAAIKMLPSYVRGLPDGTERGEFLALDLGGTNFRALWVHLTDGEAEITSEVFRVPDYIMKGTGEALFDHLAKCLAKFMEEHGLKGREKLPLGFTFSFPCKQERLNCARLANWTKGFKASGVEGVDVVELLKDACARRGDIDVDVVAVINDTVGTLMAGAYKENTCNIGVIAGTGSNACYMEKVSNIEKINENSSSDHNEMCINIEWGAFGDDGALDFVRTKYDKIIDDGSINKGQQLFEKMVAGMYLGELARVILEDLARKGVLFGGEYEAISQHGIFPTKYISEIESEFQENQDSSCQFLKTREIFEDIGIPVVTSADCAHVAYICSLVSRRAAHMVAAGIATLLKRINKPFVTVGVDGSVYRFHPTFAKLLDAKIDELLERKHKYKLMLAEDGSGRGAALVAAVATRLANEHQDRKIQG